MVRREAAARVGYLDPAFFVYYDECDFARKLADAGWHELFVPDALAVHHDQLSTDLAAGLPRIVEFHRNRDLYMRKHHGPGAARAVRWLTAWSYAVRAARRDRHPRPAGGRLPRPREAGAAPRARRRAAGAGRTAGKSVVVDSGDGRLRGVARDVGDARFELAHAASHGRPRAAVGPRTRMAMIATMAIARGPIWENMWRSWPIPAGEFAETA